MIHRIFKKQMVIQIKIADSTDYLLTLIFGSEL